LQWKNESGEKKVDIYAYLKRINYHGSLEPTLQTLQVLHEAHLLAVPFENLDIHLARKILLDEASLWMKIVEQRRGGFCYELNGMFAWLLRALGFRVSMLSADVARDTGEFGPEFDHLTLLVHLEEDWLADVGFGNSFRQPLRMQDSLVQAQDWGSYRLVQEGIYWILQYRDRKKWQPLYRFTLQPHELSDFTEMCEYQQTSPESHFTQHSVCTIATRSGRITLSDQRLITTIDGERQERLLTGQEEYRAALAEHFGIVL
jgi:N-hydroxyarylamine O-acetyltransferase